MHIKTNMIFVDVLRMLRASVLVPGEFAPFGYGDNRRVDGLISGVPGLPRETGVDYAVTSVLSVGGSAAGAKAALGAAALKEQDKRRGSVPQRRMDIDMQSAGYGFLPVVHETTGALGREAHDALFAPLLLRGIAGVILLWRRMAANGRLRGCVVRWHACQMRGIAVR